MKTHSNLDARVASIENIHRVSYKRVFRVFKITPMLENVVYERYQ